MGSFDSRSVEGVTGKDDGAVGRHPARIGPRSSRRGETPLLHVRLDDCRVAEPRTGKVDQRGQHLGGVVLPVCLAPRRRGVQRDRGGGADALGDIVGDEGDVIARPLDTSGRLDPRRSVERCKQGDRAVVLGAHQSIVEFDGRVGEQRERLGERCGHHDPVGDADRPVVDDDLPLRACRPNGEGHRRTRHVEADREVLRE